MKTYIMAIPATYEVKIEAETEDEAITNFKSDVQQSKTYNEGTDFQGGIIWFDDIQKVWIKDEE